MNPYQIGFRQTNAAANNQLASSQQTAAGFNAQPGQGIGRGRGQRAMDAYQDDLTRAQGMNSAQQTRDQDAFANQQNQFQSYMTNRNEQMQYDSLAEQMRQSQWDSRFGNMTTAWGALAGLLR